MQVQQAAGRRDQQVEPLVAKHALLRRDRHAAEHHADAQVGEARVIARVGLDLRGELACRGEHQSPQALGAVQQAREDRQDERRGLAGAGLRRADQIMAGEDEWNRARLNGHRVAITGGANAAKNGSGEPEGCERHETS